MFEDVHMKWTDKGHQFDCKKDVFNDMTCGGKGVYVFGTGIVSKNSTEVLSEYGFIIAYIDNDENKQGTTVRGVRVISLDEYMSSDERSVIVTAVRKQNESEIFDQWDKCGLKKGKNYMSIDSVVSSLYPQIMYVLKEKIFVYLTQISLTERCTLKCKKCAHGCYAVSPQKDDFSFETVKESADYFFKFVDKVKFFVLIGGEPLLYHNLDQAIIYIGKRYRNKIESLQISTNGSIIPNQNVINACREYNVNFVISNYSKNVPWIRGRINQLTDVLKKEGIKHEVFPEDTEWMDYGFEYVNRDDDQELLIDVFDKCRTECHEIRGSRFYTCVMARSVSDNLMNGLVGEDDYLELSDLNPHVLTDKAVFLEYVMGYSDKGYLDMCKHCNGPERDKYIIPASEQL